jgi:polyphosphate kinase
MATAVEPAPSRLLNRELSWIDFSGRILELAEDDMLPVLERLRFAAIFSQGLDEFFMVRVAGLLELDESDVPVRSADGLGTAQALEQIHERVGDLTARQGRLWKRELRPALAKAGIEVASIDECSEREQEKLQRYFEREIYPILTPLAVGHGQPFPYVSGLSLSLAVIASDPETGEERFARVKVPEVLDRFVPVGKRLVPLEALISHFLPMLFPGMEIRERATFRVTRDADFEVSDDADDLLEAVESELRRRRFGDVVRLELSTSASEGMRQRLVEGLGVRPSQVYEIEGLLDQSELWQLVALDRPELKHEPWVPLVPPRWARVTGANDVFDEIRRGDLLVHQPYDSFRASFEALAQAAARDPDVIAIKTAVYRTSDESSLIGSLIECAEEGKQTVCLVELKARFDERRNIEWSRAMEEAGVHVVHGFPDLKIHAKMTLVVRREEGGLRRYVHVGTGNYNASTARIYEDVGLFTADRRSPPTSPTSSTTSRGSGGRSASGSCSSRRSRCARASSTRSAGSPPRPLRARRRGSGSRSTPSSTRRSSRSSTPPRLQVSRSRSWRGRSACCARASRASRRRSASPRSSAVSWSTAGSTGSRPATTSASTSAAPT